MCFGGSTFTSIVHGQMLGYLRRSIGFISYLICTVSITLLPQSVVDSLFKNSLFQLFFFLTEALLRVHCVTSWGVDTAIRSNGSVVSATFGSIATGCGGGFLASLLLDDMKGSWMDKVTRALMTRKQEIEHLLTLSLCYQCAIGFIPLPFITPIHPVTAKSLCFTLFLFLYGIEHLFGLRLFIPIPFQASYSEDLKTKKD